MSGKTVEQCFRLIFHCSTFCEEEKRNRTLWCPELVVSRWQSLSPPRNTLSLTCSLCSLSDRWRCRLLNRKRIVTANSSYRLLLSLSLFRDCFCSAVQDIANWAWRLFFILHDNRYHFHCVLLVTFHIPKNQLQAEEKRKIKLDEKVARGGALHKKEYERKDGLIAVIERRIPMGGTA